MIKEIKYNGFSASPSDYDSLDGDLACSLGIVKEDNAVKPVLPPSTVLSLSSGQRVISIHRTPTFEHYLVVDDLNRLYWRTKDNSLLTPIKDFADKKVMQIECIGNTVLVLSDEGIYYALWKAEKEQYTMLGNKIPECPISFGLQGDRVYSDVYSVSHYKFEGSSYIKFSDENKDTITEQVLAKVNSFIAENSINKGQFMFPFFVRYAYRLYDGTLSHHSSPILMIPTTGVSPYVELTEGLSTTATSHQFQTYGVTAKLDYEPILTEASLLKLKDWSDVVQSVDIFISAPIYLYDQSGDVEGMESRTISEIFYGKPQSGELYSLYNISYFFYDNPTYKYYMKLPQKSEKDFFADIADCSQFYFLKSIELKDLTRTRNLIKVSEDYLQSLTNREVMTDDYQTHDTLIPSAMFAYNQRINIANIERKLFEGYDPASMVCYINASEETAETQIMDNYTKLLTSDGELVVKSSSNKPLLYDPRAFVYIYYPDSSAKESFIVPQENFVEFKATKQVSLKPHAFLNGAVWFNGFPSTKKWDMILLPEVSAYPTISLPNKIYTSEVNNPFRFPLEGINTIGVGEIIGISTAAKALSEGQFGQYPLYAFTSEGVWALEVSDTGTYSARQPITQDVCLNVDSITQMDSAVLFITNRGVMLLSGSNSTCISDILDSYNTLPVSDIPHLSTVIEKAGLSIDSFNYEPFREYIKNARMIYDYVNQHIILYNPTLSYAYVYSLESKSWGMIGSNITSNINSYPQAYAMTAGGNLVDFTERDITQGLNGVILTRPIKLDAPDVLKTISTVIQRGCFSKGSVQSILYGSRDLINWRLIASSKDHYLRGFSGTPYKYFRIALICNLEDKESISGCSIQYIPKLTNKLR